MGSKVTENIVMCRLGYYVLLTHNVKNESNECFVMDTR
nr:MAG TPA: hypothetical protein [Caudoviricetes sp.]